MDREEKIVTPMGATLKIKNLDCENCAKALTKQIESIDGVICAMVDFKGQKVFVEYAGESIFEEVKKTISSFEDVEIIEDKPMQAKSGERVIKIENLDCAGCAAELQEELQKIKGVKSVNVDFVGQKVIIDCEENALKEVKKHINNFEEVKVVEEEKPSQRAVIDENGNFNRVINIENLDCAHCAEALQDELKEVDGVVDVSVEFLTQKVTLCYKTEKALKTVIKKINKFEEVRVVDEITNKKSRFSKYKKDIICIFSSVVLFLVAFILGKVFGESVLAVTIINYVLYALAFIVVGYPVLISTFKNIIKGRVFDENFLMTLAAVCAIILGEYLEGVAVMILYQTGELLQSLAVDSSRQSITKLMDLKSESATRITDNGEEIVAPEELKVGDIIIVKNGEKVAVDGVVIEGKSSLDLKSLNGEAMLRDVACGDEVLSGSINVGAVLKIKVTKIYSDSAVAKILDLVENASAKKAPTEKFITKFAKYYTPAVVISAVLISVIAPLFDGFKFSEWILRALSLLVISCPCALIISVPLTYFTGIGHCAKYGILAKGATSLDNLAKVDKAFFDKTGTLTEGVFEIVDYSNKRALDIAIAVEKYSSHPIATPFKALESDVLVTDVEEIAGFGLKCKMDSKEVTVSNKSENGAVGDDNYIYVHVCVAGEEIGYIRLDDKIREEAKAAISQLKSAGIISCTMLTGDREERAKKVAAKLGLDSFKAQLLPDEKLQALEKEENTLYVGDGINDAPVMLASACAFSMGKIGSDAAIEASDFVLMSDDLKLIPKAKRISKATKRTVIFNIVFSLVVKFVLMVLSLIPAVSLPLWLAVVGDVGVMLLAVCNSFTVKLSI